METTSPVRATLREPAVAILVLAGLVQVDRGYAVDILLFFGTVVLIVADAPRWRRRLVSAEPLVPPRPERAVVAALAVGYALLVGPLPRHSAWLQLAMAAPGAIAVWIVVRPVRDRDAPATGCRVAEPGRVTEPRRWWIWPALGLVLALLELGAFLSQPNARTNVFAHPTVSTTIEPWLDVVPLRMLALALWLGIGWWLIRRVVAWQGLA